METRSDITREELTRDPIFLVQERVVIPTVGCEAEYSPDAMMYVDPGTGILVSEDDLVDHGWAAEVWRTVSVTMTREQGEEAGEKMFPNHKGNRKGIDWMVYCIPCDGSLVEMLRKQDETQDTPINETVDKYIRCHQLSSAGACDGACGDCEFGIPENILDAMGKLHGYAMENPL